MDTEPVLVGPLTEQVQLAKTDKHALNTLLHNYIPFIKKCVSSVFCYSGRYNGQLRADNLTDAMLAFVHSVQTYNPEQGAFIQYAAVLIRNRLIDNTRKEIALQKRLFSLSAQIDKESPERAPGYLRFLLEIFAYVGEQIPHTPSVPQQALNLTHRFR